MTNLDRADIQGDILEAYGNKYVHTSYVFITVRAYICPAWLLVRGTSATPRGTAPRLERTDPVSCCPRRRATPLPSATG